MSKNNDELPKGYLMEELLRNYFLKAGYYVVRGVTFNYEKFDVTDIDLWLYSRTSSVSREVTIVDSKNKRTPQAIERIFWVQGLKLAIKATNAIVATTEKRPEVKEFGRELGVFVLDGNFLGKLSTSESIVNDRITDEEFTRLINDYELNKLDGDWKGRIKYSKSLLASELSFDSCNSWMAQGAFFAEQAITKENRVQTALRCLYLICSFITVAVDYTMKEISFLDAGERSRVIKDGFTYGSQGSLGMKKTLDIAMGLVESYAKGGQAISHEVRNNVEDQLSKLNTAILGEYFSKTDVTKSLFAVAREFEQLAMNRRFAAHGHASAELRSMLLCLLDYWGLDRLTFAQLRI
jgi:hypothetical protein